MPERKGMRNSNKNALTGRSKSALFIRLSETKWYGNYDVFFIKIFVFPASNF
jgi:hypothetical protein